jgi:hypothetical protein
MIGSATSHSAVILLPYGSQHLTVQALDSSKLSLTQSPPTPIHCPPTEQPSLAPMRHTARGTPTGSRTSLSFHTYLYVSHLPRGVIYPAPPRTLAVFVFRLLRLGCFSPGSASIATSLGQPRARSYRSSAPPLRHRAPRATLLLG